MGGGGRDASARGACAALALGALVVLAVSALPTLALYLQTPRMGKDVAYDWVLPPYPEDGLAYLAWVKQAAEGALLFHVKYTPIEHVAAIFSPPFLLVGWLSALTGWSSGFSLFVGRLVFAAVFLLVLVRFSRCFGLRDGERWTFLALVCFSSGLGFLFHGRGLHPADRWMPEIDTLWSLSWNAIFAAALALMLAVLILLERATRPEEGEGGSGSVERRFLLAGALTGLLAFVHAYDVVPLGVVVVAVALVRLRGRAVRPLLRFGLAAGPPCLVQLALSLLHPVLSAHAAKAAMPSPSLLSYAVALGLPGLFAGYGVLRAGRQGRLPQLLPLLVWIVAALALAYAPVWFQRRMIIGVHVPVCLLAAIGAWDLVRRVHPARAVRVALVALLVAATTPTHFANFRDARRQSVRDAAAYYVPASLREALAFLDDHVPSREVVLAQYTTARLVPGLSGNTVTLGHWAQSVDAEAQRAWLERLLGPGDAEQKRAMLRSSRVGILLVDPAMRRRWPFGRDPRWLSQVGPTIYRRDGIRIIRIDRSDRPQAPPPRAVR